MENEIRWVLNEYDVFDKMISIKPYGNGHINHTFFLTIVENSIQENYILQRLNQNIFKNPTIVMGNIELVTTYLKEQVMLAGGNPKREVVSLRKTRDQKAYVRDENGEFWRMLYFISGSLCLETVENDDDMYA